MLRAKVVLVCATLLLSACAAMDGRPSQVISVSDADAVVALYRPAAAIEALGTIPATDVAGRNTYRNKVVSAYLSAIDAHHNVFVRNLSRSGKGAHLGFDTTLLGLTAAAAIFEKAASELASGATAVAGLRGSFDRELFAEKALPIITSLMDSRRLAIRAEITRGLSQPESSYTLEDAFSDLMRYEMAGTIDGALNDAAADAGARAKEADYDFSKARDLCVVDAVTDGKRRALMTSLEKFEADAEGAKDASAATQYRQLLQKAAQGLGINATVPTNRAEAFAILAAMRDQIEVQCDGAGVDALRAKITTAGVPLT